MVRGTLDENAPSFSCGTVDVVDLEGHLVLGALDTGAEVLVVGLSCTVRNTMLPSCSL